MSNYDDLIDWVTAQGLTKGEAELGVRRCAMAMARNGMALVPASAAVGVFLRMSTAAAPQLFIGAVGVGAGLTLVNSASCQEVRDALKYWTTAPIN